MKTGNGELPRKNTTPFVKGDYIGLISKKRRNFYALQKIGINVVK